MTATPQDHTVLAFPTREEARLRLALRRLDEALEEQRAAVAAWRAELGLLGEVTAALDDTVAAFRAELDSTAEAVRAVGDEARRLEQTAEVMATVARGA